jgi:hypothetical protein
MPDYSNGKVYKLVSNQTDKVYIGCTTQPLCERKAGHKANFKLYQLGRYHYVTSFDLVKLDDVDIVLLENVKCQNKEELHARQRFWIESTECVNKIIPSRKMKEYREAKSEEIKQQKQIYREKNKSKIDKYREVNKEVIADKQKSYRQKNTNKLHEKHKCICGGVYTYNHKHQHINTVKHQNYVVSLGK